PEARLSVLVGIEAKGVVEMNPYVDNVFVMGKTWFSATNGINLGEILSILRKIRKENFDIGIDLRGDMRNILLMFLGKVKYRVGYGVTGGGFLLNKIPDYEKDMQEVEKNIKLIKELDCKVTNRRLQIYYSQSDKANVLELLERENVGQSNSLLAIHMGAGYPSKSWKKEKFLHLLKELNERNYGRVVLIGNDNNDSFVNIHKGLNIDYINTIGRLSIRELAVLLERCSVLISCDSGPVHVAAAVGTPCIVLFSGTNTLKQWGSPDNNVNRVIHKEVECSPCEMRICPQSTHLCMDKIKVSDVLCELDALFGSMAGMAK
ncbi:MAG TPA: glycosyltransferase family 9 protein, partial [Candidatus Scalindua sp.]|nr:glycosyltransferase family 9 protein [Candidatus Scalindua sp.]